MQVVALLAVNLGGELRDLIQPGFLTPPIETMPQVVGQVLELGQRHVVIKIRTRIGRGIWPAGEVEAAMKIIQLAVGDLDLERLGSGKCGHINHARDNRGRVRSAIAAKLQEYVAHLYPPAPVARDAAGAP